MIWLDNGDCKKIAVTSIQKKTYSNDIKIIMDKTKLQMSSMRKQSLNNNSYN